MKVDLIHYGLGAAFFSIAHLQFCAEHFLSASVSALLAVGLIVLSFIIGREEGGE